jgi:hypothetical protein
MLAAFFEDWVLFLQAAFSLIRGIDRAAVPCPRLTTQTHNSCRTSIPAFFLSAVKAPYKTEP